MPPAPTRAVEVLAMRTAFGRRDDAMVRLSRSWMLMRVVVAS
jgi:hypothetical protein